MPKRGMALWGEITKWFRTYRVWGAFKKSSVLFTSGVPGCWYTLGNHWQMHAKLNDEWYSQWDGVEWED